MLPIARHSLIGHTAYADLLRTLKDTEVGELRGTVERKAVGGKTYLYDRYRLGEKVESRYIGPSTPELEERIARAEAIRAAARERQAQRTRLVRLLRAEGYQGLDAGTGSLLAALARIGAFRLGGRSWARSPSVSTRASLASGSGPRRWPRPGTWTRRVSKGSVGDQVTEPVAQALGELAFAPMPSLDGRSTWRWRDGSDRLVEFLTPAFGEEGPQRLSALGVDAQGLHCLNFLLREPINAVALYRSGLLVQVPDPARCAIHKLIVADRRKDRPDSLKAEKDRLQAGLLVSVLAQDRPDELLEAYEDALSRGPRWRERIGRTLSRMPEAAGRLAPLG